MAKKTWLGEDFSGGAESFLFYRSQQNGLSDQCAGCYRSHGISSSSRDVQGRFTSAVPPLLPQLSRVMTVLLANPFDRNDISDFSPALVRYLNPADISGAKT